MIISIQITAEFPGYPWNSSPIYGETTTERRTRTECDRNAARESEAQRNAEWDGVLDFLQTTLRFAGGGDRNNDRSRRNNPLTAAYTPRYDPYDCPSNSTPRSTGGVDASPRPPTPAVNSRQSWAYQSTEPATPQLPTATPEPEWAEGLVLNNVLEEPLSSHEPTITFDISRGPDSVAWKRPTLSLAWGPDDFDLPATFPPVFEMTISVVVEDPLPNFEWPVVVSNPSGITCGDVINAVWQAFHEYVPKREYGSWDDQRREEVKRAFFKRSRDPTRREPVPGTRECLRRIDYMSTQTGTRTGKGDGIMFRGMTPAFEANRWLMFVGPSGSE